MTGPRMRRPTRLVTPSAAPTRSPEAAKRITVDELNRLLAGCLDGAAGCVARASFSTGRRCETADPAEILAVEEPQRLRALALDVRYPDGSALHLELDRWAVWTSGPSGAGQDGGGSRPATRDSVAEQRARTVGGLYRMLPARQGGRRGALAAAIALFTAVPVLLWLLAGTPDLPSRVALAAATVAACLLGWLFARFGGRRGPNRTEVLPRMAYHRRRPEVVGFAVVGVLFTVVVAALVAWLAS